VDSTLMGWVDRINRRVLDAVARKRSRQADAVPPAAPLSPASVARLVRLDLVANDEYVGETLMLWGLLDDGSPTEITEASADWAAVGQALQGSGRLVVPLDAAVLRLLADPERTPVCLLGQAPPAA